MSGLRPSPAVRVRRATFRRSELDTCHDASYCSELFVGALAEGPVFEAFDIRRHQPEEGFFFLLLTRRLGGGDLESCFRLSGGLCLELQ
jgi:hypothetical protein